MVEIFTFPEHITATLWIKSAWCKLYEGSKAVWEKQQVISTSKARSFSDFKQNWILTFCVKQWKSSILCQENEYLIGADC